MSTGHPTREELEAGLEEILESPKDEGRLELIAVRPASGKRRILERGRLSLAEGLVGDNWKARGSRRTADGAAHPGMQLNIMNARVALLVAQHAERRALAGDQLYIDLDPSPENLPPGTELGIGEALVAVTDQPHLGCKKFVRRFGVEALKFVNSQTGRKPNLRGIN
ncbi:MAG: MOSC domain-containing protein, partial [Acidobacteria bacterium]|nr:MOSC domain-containing protein [Acidobacteriota bacterium]NIQ84713.1 MOSC domain-containing protein [Acidobacteriota bacterium]